MNMKEENPILTPAFFYILFALRNGERHGYEIMKIVNSESENKVNMGPGTLYGSIKKMLNEDFIKEVVAIDDKKNSSEGNDERRKYYALTEKGRRSLTAEIGRFYNIIGRFHQDSHNLTNPIPTANQD